MKDSQKPYLIGGVWFPKKKRQYLQEGELNLYQDWGRRIDASFNEYIGRIMFKLDPTTNLFSYRSKAFEV